MGLYDNRLAALSEARRSGGRVDQRRRRPFARPSAAPRAPERSAFARPAARPFAPPPPPVRRPSQRPAPPVATEAARRPPMDIQSLLFSRADGWTASKAKQWAKSHGYKHGKVHVTDQYIRIRQFDPKGLKVKRTITLGRGIRAVVAREEGDRDMAARRRRASKEEARRPRRRPARRRAREEASATEAKRPRRRRPARRRARETAATEAKRPRRRPARRRAREEARRPRRAPSQMMEAPRRRRRPARRRAREEAWHGARRGHSDAAKKGWARRRKRGTAHPRRRRTREFAYEEARRPARRRSTRRRRAREESTMMEARRPRRRSSRRRSSRRRSRTREYGAYEARRSSRRRHIAREGRGTYALEMGLAVLTAGVGYILADGLDRFLATYDPAAATKPNDRFTSDGAGTLANTLNVSSAPDWKRIGAAVALTVVPATGSVFVEQPMVRAGLEGLAIGAGVSLFKLFWNNVVMGKWLQPKDTSPAGLQKSMIARLYPAEVAAAINMAAAPTAGQPAAVSSGGGSGALSGPPGYSGYPQAGVGAPPADVGPFALGAESPYPDTAQALRRAAGVSGPGSNMPTLQNVWGTGTGPGGGSMPGIPGVSDFPTAAQAMGVGAAVDNIAKTVAATTGATPAQAVQAAAQLMTEPFNLVAALARALPHIQTEILHECARAVHPHVVRLHAATPAASAPTPPPPPPAPAHGVTGLSAAPTAPAPQAPASSAWMPGPPAPPGPGPQPPDTACGCIGDDNPFLGFIGDAQEEPLYNLNGKAA